MNKENPNQDNQKPINSEDGKARPDRPVDENVLDFAALQHRLSSPSFSSESDLTSEVWPLYLVTTFVDHYIFGDVIGNGSYAEVRECIDTRNLERCAVKIINKEYLRRQAPNALANQLQEIRLLRRLKHPNVIAMKECLFKGSKIYIVLEHCTLVLQDLLAQKPGGRLCIPLARNLFYQLSTGLHYLHTIGIVHRDVKPQNLLLTTCGELKIIDFGVSQKLSMWSRDDECFNYEGSPLFQAPEVVCGQRKYAGFKVDVWSAGVVLYLILFGQYPFDHESLLGLYDKILTQDFSIPDRSLANIDVISDLIGAMLEKSAQRRISFEQVLEHPWLSFDCSLHQTEHNEFIDVLEPQPEQMEVSNVRDIYRSMTVLPYLHNHHFPQLAPVKAKPSPTPSPLSTPSVSPSGSIRSFLGKSPAGSQRTIYSTTSVEDPHQIVEDGNFEWGTERQYNLLKLPSIRANRVRHVRRRKKRNRAK